MNFDFGLGQSAQFTSGLNSRSLSIGVSTVMLGPAFTSTWNTSQSGTSNSEQISLPLIASGTYNFEVDWGDGQSDIITAWDDATKTHTYNTPGTYNVSINGTIVGWQFNNGGDKLKLSSITQWGVFKPGNVGSQFYGCHNLTINAADALNLSGVTSMYAMFRGCNALNQDISSWNTSEVTTMSHLFNGCGSFNQDISGWDTANVTNMSFMLYNCSSFNQNVSSWNTHKLQNASGLFQGCSVFDQDIGSWNTHNVTSMFSMFCNCAEFNQDIGSWNTHNTTNMSGMFCVNLKFNQDISGWDTSKVQDFSVMFSGAAVFDQNIGGWDITSATSLTQMFSPYLVFRPTLSTANYDALLTGWNGQAHNDGLNFHGGNSKYTANSAASAARDDFTNNHSWTITDRGPV